MSDNLTFEIELLLNDVNTKLDKLVSDSQKKATEAGKIAGKSFGNTFNAAAQSIMSYLSFRTVLSNAMSAINAARDAATSNQVLTGVIAAQNKQAIANKAIINDVTSSLEQKALAIGFNSDKIYEEVSATSVSKGATNALKIALNNAKRALEDQTKAYDASVKVKTDQIKTIDLETKSINTKIKALQRETQETIKQFKISSGYNNLETQNEQLETQIDQLQIQKLQNETSGQFPTIIANQNKLLDQQIKTLQLKIKQNDLALKPLNTEIDSIKEAAELRKQSYQDELNQLTEKKDVILAQIEELRLEFEPTKNKLEIDVEEAQRKLQDLQSSISGGGMIKRVSKDFQEALKQAQQNGINILDEKQIRAEVKRLANIYSNEVGLSEAVFTNAFANVARSGITDLSELSSTVEGFVKIASQGNLPLSEGVEQLSQQFTTELAALGERAGLQDEYISQIGPRGLAILQAEGKLRGKNFDELTKEERALAKARGLKINIANAEGVYNAKVEAGTFALDKNIEKGKELTRQIGNALTPAFNAFNKILTPVIENLINFTENNPALVTSIVGIITVISLLALGFTALNTIALIFGTTIGAVFLPITAIVLGVIAVITALYFAFNNNFLGIRDIVDSLVKFFVDDVYPKIQTIFNKIKDELLPILFRAFEAIKPFIIPIFDFITRQLKELVEIAKGVIKGLLTYIEGFIDLLVGVFTGNRQKVFDGFLKMFQGFGEAVGSIFKGIINTIIDQINNGIRTVNNLINNLPDVDIPGVGKLKDKFSGVKIPEIPRFAKGGEFIVPAGYPNDSYLMRAQSGERVTIQPASQVTGSYNQNTTINNYGNSNPYRSSILSFN